MGEALSNMPTTSILSLGSQALGGITSVFGAMAQGDQQAKQAKYESQIAASNAEIARQNALISDQNARDQINAGIQDEQRQRRLTTLKIGQARAQMGASGVDVGSGSFVDQIGDLASAGEEDALTIKNNTASKAYLAHQQGVAGAAALLKADPNAKASDVLAPFYKDGVNVKAITGNGGTADMTAGQFADMWKGRYQSAASLFQGAGDAPSSLVSSAAGSRADEWSHRFSAANSISDPVVKAGVLSGLTQRMEMETRLAKMRQDENEQSAFRFVDKGGSPNDLPVDVRSALGREGMSQIYGYAETRAKGMQPQTDWGVYDTLRSMKVNDPQELLKLSPLALRAKLDDGAFKEFEGWRDDAAKGVQQAAQGPFSLDKQIDTLAERLGWAGQSNAEKRGMLARQIGMAVSDAQTQKGKTLTFDERQQIVDRFGISAPSRGWFSTQEPLAEIRMISEIPNNFVVQTRQRNPKATDQDIVDLYTQMALADKLTGQFGAPMGDIPKLSKDPALWPNHGADMAPTAPGDKPDYVH